MTRGGFFIKEGRLRPTWRVVCYLVVYLLGTLAVQLGILVPVTFIWALTAGFSSLDEQALVELSSSLPVLLALGAGSLALTLILTYVFRRFLDGRTMLDLGFRSKPGWLKEVLGGLLLGAVLISLTFLFQWGAGWLKISGFAWHTESGLVVLGKLLGAVIFMSMVAFYEELAYRGYVLQNLQAEWGTIVALIVSSIVFGLFHGLNPNVTPLALANISLAGVLLAACYLVTGGLWLPMAYHFSWNFVQGPVLSLPVSGLATGGLLLTEAGGSPVVTGGAFGPEGGLLSTVTMSLGLLILLLWRSRRKPRARE